jgi:hypothetical protein
MISGHWHQRGHLFIKAHQRRWLVGGQLGNQPFGAQLSGLESPCTTHRRRGIDSDHDRRVTLIANATSVIPIKNRLCKCADQGRYREATQQKQKRVTHMALPNSAHLDALDKEQRGKWRTTALRRRRQVQH